MQENFYGALQRTLVWEGGFSDHPQDPAPHAVIREVWRWLPGNFGPRFTCSG